MYLRCDVGEWCLERGSQWPRLMPWVFEFCSLFCTMENTLAGQVIQISSTSLSRVSYDKHKSVSSGKTSCLGRSAWLKTPCKGFGGLALDTLGNIKGEWVLYHSFSNILPSLFLTEIKLMLVCDRLRIKRFLTFFAVFLYWVVCWFKICLIFLACGNKHNWRKKLARNKLAPLSMQC